MFVVPSLSELGSVGPEERPSILWRFIIDTFSLCACVRARAVMAWPSSRSLRYHERERTVCVCSELNSVNVRSLWDARGRLFPRAVLTQVISTLVSKWISASTHINHINYKQHFVKVSLSAESNKHTRQKYEISAAFNVCYNIINMSDCDFEILVS